MSRFSSDPGGFGVRLYNMGFDRLDTIQLEFYENPNGDEPGVPQTFELVMSQSGLGGLELLPKSQWKRIVAELAALVDKLPEPKS